MPYARYKPRPTQQSPASRTSRATADPRPLRMRMVNEQLVSRGIADRLVLNAMAKVPRHLFVSDAFIPHAYSDTPLPIGFGQSISQPYVVARMLELLKLKSGMRVLEIGLGSGYQAAVMAAMGCSVFGIERIRELHRQATGRLRSLGLRAIHTHCGDGTLGMPLAAPFDRIIVAAGGPEIPAPLLEQLDSPGIMLVPVGAKKREQRLLRIHKINGKIRQEDMGEALFVNLVGDHGWRL